MAAENSGALPHSLPPAQISAILDAVTDGVFTMDAEWRITSFNRAAERITGISREQALGRPCYEVFKGSICEQDCGLRRRAEGEHLPNNRSIYILDGKGRRLPLSVSCFPIRDGQGRMAGGVEVFCDLSLVEDLRRQVERRFRCEDILSRNHRMQAIFEILPAIATRDDAVLIRGESGTGKQLLARAIHNMSARRGRPFVTVNCGALPASLLEAELFGYRVGAFTEAHRDKPGRFALAEGGTLLLHDIDLLPAALRERLLRILRERVYEPLGSGYSLKADVRIAATTRRDLGELVARRKFDRSLQQRIGAIELELPPLRERKEDIPLLTEHILERLNRLHGKELCGISAAGMEALMGRDFPGNVRELENLLEMAFLLCDAGAIGPEHLLTEGDGGREKRRQEKATTLEEMEQKLIFNALRRNDWNRKAAARELGIHRSTLFRKLKTLGIEMPSQDGRSAS